MSKRKRSKRSRSDPSKRRQVGLVSAGKRVGLRNQPPREKAVADLTKADLERIANEHPDARVVVDGRGKAKLVTYFQPEVVAEHELEEARKAEAERAARAAGDADRAVRAAGDAKKAVPAADADRAARAEAAAEPHVPMRRLEHFPETADQELVESCVEASRQIRHERQVAYDRAVVLECEYAELSLLPIKGGGAHLCVPFRVRRSGGSLQGAILLGATNHPLPAMIDARAETDDAVGAWACALLGFAAATCIELEPVEQPVSRREDRPRLTTGVSSGGGSHRRPQTRTVPRRRAWPAYFEPVGRWVHYRGSFVAGHRRRLSDGRSASAEARDRARDVGIVLGPRETWVQPHTRGIPEDMEMRFRWRAPEALSAS